MSGLFGGAAAPAASTSNTQGDLSRDVEVSQPPEDTVTDLAFSSAADLLAVPSWDKKVRIYEINAQGQSQGKHMYEHEAPVFSVDWSKVGQIHMIRVSESQHRLTSPLTGWNEARLGRRRQEGHALRRGHGPADPDRRP